MLDNDRAAAFEELAAYYADVFGNGRNEYAIPAGALSRRDQAAADGRVLLVDGLGGQHQSSGPGRQLHAELAARGAHRQPADRRRRSCGASSASCCCWRGIGGMVWYFASQEHEAADGELPRSDPLLGLKPTPSQRATVKYFFVVAALWVVQVALGAIAAHYGVEGNGFYGIPLAKWLPYSVTRTWHLQIGIFWIATSWLATGLYIAPAVSGSEPKGQRLGVNVLFVALVARRRRIARRRVARHPAEAGQPVVLVRHAGLRVRRPRPRLADPAVRRTVLLAVADVARPEAGAGASATRTARC